MVISPARNFTDAYGFRYVLKQSAEEHFASFPYTKFSPSIEASPSGRLLRETVLSTLRVPTRGANNGTVLLALRAGTRVLRDVRTLHSRAIAEALSARGLVVEVVYISDNTSTAEQVAMFARAAVVISVHGSQLTNVAWMRPGSAVIEVMLRNGWCLDPWRPADGVSCQRCKAYHKADFANLARLFELKYWYYDAVFLSKRYGVNGEPINPIHVRNVLVDAEELADVAVAAYHRVIA